MFVQTPERIGESRGSAAPPAAEHMAGRRGPFSSTCSCVRCQARCFILNVLKSHRHPEPSGRHWHFREEHSRLPREHTCLPRSGQAPLLACTGAPSSRDRQGRNSGRGRQPSQPRPQHLVPRTHHGGRQHAFLSGLYPWLFAVLEVRAGHIKIWVNSFKNKNKSITC